MTTNSCICSETTFLMTNAMSKSSSISCLWDWKNSIPVIKSNRKHLKLILVPKASIFLKHNLLKLSKISCLNTGRRAYYQRYTNLSRRHWNPSKSKISGSRWEGLCVLMITRKPNVSPTLFVIINFQMERSFQMPITIGTHSKFNKSLWDKTCSSSCRRVGANFVRLCWVGVVRTAVLRRSSLLTQRTTVC